MNSKFDWGHLYEFLHGELLEKTNIGDFLNQDVIKELSDLAEKSKDKLLKGTILNIFGNEKLIPLAYLIALPTPKNNPQYDINHSEKSLIYNCFENGIPKVINIVCGTRYIPERNKYIKSVCFNIDPPLSSLLIKENEDGTYSFIKVNNCPVKIIDNDFMKNITQENITQRKPE